MRTRPFLWLVVTGVLAVPGAAAEPDFAKDVLPVLTRHCLACHGAKGKGGLDLRTLTGLRSGGKTGPAVVAGKPAEGRLAEHLADGTMPPEGKPRPTADELKVLRE